MDSSIRKGVKKDKYGLFSQEEMSMIEASEVSDEVSDEASSATAAVAAVACAAAAAFAA